MTHSSSDRPSPQKSGKHQNSSEHSQTSSKKILQCVANFDTALRNIGKISPQEFRHQFLSQDTPLSQISWNVRTAAFWDKFRPISTAKSYSARGKLDFHLNKPEVDVLKQNGFVVSERLGDSSFAGLFHRIYSADLPVFVSADAILHAWHRSYDAVLEELEETYLFHALSNILEGMTSNVHECLARCGKNSILTPCISDIYYFLAVARSLLNGEQVKTALLSQDERVSVTLKAIESSGHQVFSLFGRNRQMDFSQFKVRGHYENSPQLQQYFRAMMWCGRVDFRLGGNVDESSLRELGGAIVLHYLLKQSGKFEQWQQFDELLQTFIGTTDSMTFAQIDVVLDEVGIHSLEDVSSWEKLVQVQEAIARSEFGIQAISSHPYGSDVQSNSPQFRLPRSFTVMGQKFVFDSWVTSNVVSDRVIWNGNKVPRRVPSCLDVAFAVFGNNHVVQDLYDRMTAKSGRPFRDGLNYQHNLAALRQVIDAQDESIWDENIYMGWLSLLRELSKPTTGTEYPEVMRTRAWAMKTLNTQLASWTQLRHDTILYVKQSCTFYLTCFYPAGFVEPRLSFWERFEHLVQQTADLIERTPFSDSVIKKTPNFPDAERAKWVAQHGAEYADQFIAEWSESSTTRIDPRKLQKKHVNFFRNFAEKVAILKELVRKELAHEEFSEADVQFLRKIVEIIDHGSGAPSYTGWYFSLFYKGHEDAEKWDAIVADVHTDSPDSESGDPGCVLHQGVGKVNLLVMAVDSGEDKMLYAGPVLSHYEFDMPGVSRKSDSEWRHDFESNQVPAKPEWTQSYIPST